jgi:hypothetical protein
MRKTLRIGMSTALLAALAATAVADQLILKDGQVLEGNFVGRADGMVTFEIAGQQLKIPESSVESMTMTMGSSAAPAAQAAPAPAPAPPPPPPPPPKPKAKPTVPAGTRLTLRMAESIDTKRHKAGHRFIAKLEADLTAGGVVVAPRGTTVYGQLVSATSSGRVVGSSSLTLAFTDILINNKMYPIATEPMSGKTDNTAKKSGRQIGRAAVLGGLIDGSSGAKTGAAVGAGAAIITGGNQAGIASGTLLDTQLRSPLTID